MSLHPQYHFFFQGRDIKVHIGTSWFQKQENSKKNSPPLTSAPLQKSISSAAVTGFHPLKRGSSFNVRNKMEESFNTQSAALTSTFGLVNAGREKETRTSQDGSARAEFVSKKLGLLVDRHVPKEWKSQTSSSGEKSPSSPLSFQPSLQSKEKPRNDHSRPSFIPNLSRNNFHPAAQVHPRNHHHTHHSPQKGIAANVKVSQSNKGKWHEGKKIDGESSSVVDSDLDCFLNTIDFGHIDSQDLQELLSSY
jgi:hypothetical protein